ncbi:hypothetical protein Tco_0152235 [Tanacetum coccineum]
MQMLYCFVNNIHVDYAELLWEGFHYSLTNPTTMIPYPRFIKLIVSHYMTTFPEILRRTRDRYHNLTDDVMIKSIFNSRKSKGVVFGVDVPTTQSQPIESTQGTHRITSTPRIPNLEIAERESNDLVLQDTLQVSLAEQKSREELEAKQNAEKVKEHLMAEEIEKSVEGSENVEENVEVASSPLRYDDNQTNPGTRLEPRSYKERPEKGKEIKEYRNTPSPTTTRSLRTHSTIISLDTEKLLELTETNTIPLSSTPSSSSSKLSVRNLDSRSWEAGGNMQGINNIFSTNVNSIMSPHLSFPTLSATNRLLSLLKPNPGRFKRYKSFFDKLQGKYGYLFGHLTTRFMPRRKFNELARHLQDIMMESLPKMDDERIKKILQTQVPLHVAQGIILEREKTQAEVAKMIADDIQQERKNF